MSDMPPLVDGTSAGPRGGGSIPPPPTKIPPPAGARFESPYNPFPGPTQPNYPTWAPPATAPAWLPSSQGQWSPWPYARYPNWSPYSTTTPAASFGELSPASHAINTPGGGGGFGQPIAPSPWFNAGAGAANGALHRELPANAGTETWRKPSFNGGFEPAWDRRLDELPLERTHSQEPYTHSPAFDTRGYPLTRSLSAGPVKRARSRSRSRSRVRQMWPRYPEEYDSEDLARRPKDFRPDFDSRKWFLPIHRHKSEVEEFKDPNKRVLTDLLLYKRSLDRCVQYDLRTSPSPRTLIFPHLGRAYNDLDLAQLATHPPVDRMRLLHPLLPWYIDVFQRQPNGITVGDVIWTMFYALQQQIQSRHYYNEDLEDGARERIAKAFESRTGGYQDEHAKGIRKVDYLEDKVIFVGLVRMRDGRWEMKTVA